jgi:uncharacterized membrane protein
VRLNVNLWRIPLFLSVGGLLLFALTSSVDVLDAQGVVHLPHWLRVGGIDDARAILSALLGAVCTVLALIFSVALLVVSMVATLFGPRLLYRFLQDWVTQVTIGLFLATFIDICLVFLVTQHSEHGVFVPQLSIFASWLMVIASFGFLVYYSHRIAVSIQNPDMVARIVDDMDKALLRSQPVRSIGTMPAQIPDGAEVLTQRCGYLQCVNHAPLIAAAARVGAVIQLRVRVGTFILEGEVLAEVSPAERAPRLAQAIVRHVRIGRHRTLEQDPEFGLAQIIEIAIRALSHGINDTYTGVACVDWIAEALLGIAKTEDDGSWYDAAGTLRLRIPPLKFARVVKAGFDQIRQAAVDTPAVLIRQLDIIRRLAPRVSVEARAALLVQADAIRQGAGSLRAQIDRDDVEAAWRRLRPPPIAA